MSRCPRTGIEMQSLCKQLDVRFPSPIFTQRSTRFLVDRIGLDTPKLASSRVTDLELLNDVNQRASEAGVAPVLVPAAPLWDADVQRIVETAAHRLVRLLQQRGILDETEADTLAEQKPLLAALSAAIQVRLATGPRTGYRVRLLLSDSIEGLHGGPLCF